MNEIKGESIKERLVRVETQRVADVEINKNDHKAILVAINECKTLLSNHLAHTSRLNWTLFYVVLMAIAPYFVWGIIEIIKNSSALLLP